jgi:uncharacterized membrane protein YbhN (UPF0104 family)
MTEAVAASARRPWVWPALRLAVPVGLLALLWQVADGRAVLARLSGVDLRWLLAALVAANLQTVLSALRWRLTAARLGQHLPVSEAVGEYYLAQLVNQTLPGGVLGDAARAVRARRQSLAVSAQAVVIERFAGQAALLAVTLAGFAVALASPGTLALPTDAAEVLLVVAGLGGAAVVVLLALMRFWPRVGRTLWQSVRVAVLARGVWRRQVALGLAIVGCNLLAFAFCARATGSVLPPEAVVTLVPLVLTAMVVPLSVAGWGLREGAAAALLPLAGLTPDAAVAASLAFGGVILAGSLPGAVVPLMRRRADLPV